MNKLIIVIFLCFSAFFGEAQTLKTTTVSWYGLKFHGKKTANGEIFDMYDFTAANAYLKFGTKVLIINPKNGKKVIVRINDRGAYQMDRNGKPIYPLEPHIIRGFDLSMAAFNHLAPLSTGLLKVKYLILK